MANSVVTGIRGFECSRVHVGVNAIILEKWSSMFLMFLSIKVSTSSIRLKVSVSANSVLAQLVVG